MIFKSRMLFIKKYQEMWTGNGHQNASDIVVLIFEKYLFSVAGTILMNLVIAVVQLVCHGATIFPVTIRPDLSLHLCLDGRQVTSL